MKDESLQRLSHASFDKAREVLRINNGRLVFEAAIREQAQQMLEQRCRELNQTYIPLIVDTVPGHLRADWELRQRRQRPRR